MVYRISTMDDLDNITDFTYTKNSQDIHHIAYCCKEKDSIYEDFKSIIVDDNNRMLTAWEGDTLCGVLGLFSIDEMKRVDCVGPFVETISDSNSEGAKEEYLRIACRLIELAREIYFGYSLNFHMNYKNQECISLMDVIHATQEDIEYEMTITRDIFEANRYSNRLIPYTSEYEQSIRKIHEQIGSNFYLTMNQILKTLGKEREVYLLIKDENVIGYGALLFYSTTKEESCMEILGIDKEMRGKGYGTLLVHGLLCESYKRASMNKVKLIVDDDNPVAIHLYESFGFETTLKTVSYTLYGIKA